MILNTSAMKCKLEKVDMLVLNITDRHDIEISLSAQASAVIDSDLYFARQPTNHRPRPNRRER